MSMVFLALLFSVRPIDSLAAEILDAGARQSAVVRGLLQTLEASNVIVHVQSSRELPSGIGGLTRFVVSRGGHRYVRITIRADLPAVARLAILAHELQHACEIAASAADDVESLRKLFDGAGRRYGEYFETRAAIRTEHQVRAELRAVPDGITVPTRAGSRTAKPTPGGLQPEPVVKFHH